MISQLGQDLREADQQNTALKTRRPARAAGRYFLA